MPTPAEPEPVNHTLTGRIRKTFSSTERSFTLDVEFDAAPGFTYCSVLQDREKLPFSIASPVWLLRMQEELP